MSVNPFSAHCFHVLTHKTYILKKVYWIEWENERDEHGTFYMYIVLTTERMNMNQTRLNTFSRLSLLFYWAFIFLLRLFFKLHWRVVAVVFKLIFNKLLLWVYNRRVHLNALTNIGNVREWHVSWIECLLCVQVWTFNLRTKYDFFRLIIFALFHPFLFHSHHFFF